MIKIILLLLFASQTALSQNLLDSEIAYSHTSFDSECFTEAYEKRGNYKKAPNLTSNCKNKDIEFRAIQGFKDENGYSYWTPTAKVTVCGTIRDIDSVHGVFLGEASIKGFESKSTFLSFTDIWPNDSEIENINYREDKVCVSGYAGLSDARAYGRTLDTMFLGDDTTFTFLK